MVMLKVEAGSMPLMSCLKVVYKIGSGLYYMKLRVSSRPWFRQYKEKQ